MDPVSRFLEELDALWEPAPGEGRIVLRVLGSAALFIQTGYERGTKDGDVLRTAEIEGPVEARLVMLAGLESDLYQRHRIYLDVVGQNVPMLPRHPLWHPCDLDLEHFDVRVLDVTDVVASKLKRFIGTDRDDIRAMVEGGHVEHHRLLERLKEVVERYRFDCRASHLAAMVDRFHQVEADWFGLDEESSIALPIEW